MIFENYNNIDPDLLDDIDFWESEYDSGYSRDYPNPADY